MRRFHSAVRELAILIVVVAVVSELARQKPVVDFVQTAWLAILAIAVIAGVIWSISRIYKNPPARQELPIGILVVSTLLACPVIAYVFFYVFILSLHN